MLPSGVPGLDAVLGGGLPEYSFNIIAGGPGAGKTTLAQQIMFARATEGATALYFTVLGEPTLKMLRHVQQYAFFDPGLLSERVQFVNLSAEAMDHDLRRVLDRIMSEVDANRPDLVMVDSFRTVVRAGTTEGEVQEFVQRLALHLTSWEATTFLIGEYLPEQSHENPIFTVADGLIWLSQSVEDSASIRRMHVAKARGCAQLPGFHTFAISEHGLRIFPRQAARPARRPRASPMARASTGVEGLDALMNGGIPAGASVLVSGPSGSGKSVLARQFVAAGARLGEPGVITIFEEHPEQYLDRAERFGPSLRPFVEQGLVEMLHLPLYVTTDEALAAARDAVDRLGAKRLVIDSLSGLELTLAPSLRHDFREAVVRLVSALNGEGVTIMMTSGLVESFIERRMSPQLIEVLADVVVMQRYVELDGKVERITTVVKMRDSDHDRDIRRYTVETSGLVVGERLGGSQGLLMGLPVRIGGAVGSPEGLTAEEVQVLRAIEEGGPIGRDELKRRTKLRAAAVEPALERLEALGYAARSRRRGEVIYRSKP
jgi:circadian clock protein KaiC